MYSSIMLFLTSTVFAAPMPAVDEAQNPHLQKRTLLPWKWQHTTGVSVGGGLLSPVLPASAITVGGANGVQVGTPGSLLGNVLGGVGVGVQVRRRSVETEVKQEDTKDQTLPDEEEGDCDAEE